jgi:hypothetical protein
MYYDLGSCIPWNYFKMAHIYIFPTVLYPLQKIAMTTSMYITVVLAFGRHVAVSKPISTYVNSATGTAKRVLINISSVLVFAILFNMPTFFEFYVEWCSFGCSEGTQLQVKEYNVHNNETFEDFTKRVYEFSVNEHTFGSTNTTEKEINNSIHIVTKLHFHVNTFRLDSNYKLYYINISQNLVTGFIPLIVLGILNLNVYLHLRKRRKEVAQLTQGNYSNFSIHHRENTVFHPYKHMYIWK